MIIPGVGRRIVFFDQPYILTHTLIIALCSCLIYVASHIHLILSDVGQDAECIKKMQSLSLQLQHPRLTFPNLVAVFYES